MNEEKKVSEKKLTDKISSSKFKFSAIIIGSIIIAFATFTLGVAVGFQKARFSYHFSENYERNFTGGHKGADSRQMRNSHGLAGEIISLNGNNLIIKDQDEKEIPLEISEKTLIKMGSETIQSSDLKTGEKIVIVGRPNDNGVINAELIRIFNQTNQ
jgi:hypothetical protein